VVQDRTGLRLRQVLRGREVAAGEPGHDLQAVRAGAHAVVRQCHGDRGALRGRRGAHPATSSPASGCDWTSGLVRRATSASMTLRRSGSAVFHSRELVLRREGCGIGQRVDGPGTALAALDDHWHWGPLVDVREATDAGASHAVRAEHHLWVAVEADAAADVLPASLPQQCDENAPHGLAGAPDSGELGERDADGLLSVALLTFSMVNVLRPGELSRSTASSWSLSGAMVLVMSTQNHHLQEVEVVRSVAGESFGFGVVVVGDHLCGRRSRTARRPRRSRLPGRVGEHALGPHRHAAGVADEVEPFAAGHEQPAWQLRHVLGGHLVGEDRGRCCLARRDLTSIRPSSPTRPSGE
jgi:hypothetical protein